MSIKLGVSSYSYSKLGNAFKAVKNAKAQGFEYIEIVDSVKACSFIKRLYYKKLAKLIKAEGMTVTSYTVGANLTDGNVDKEVERIKGQIDIASDVLGAKFLRHDAVGWGVKQDVTPLIKDMAKHVRKISEYGKSKGVTTMVENHGLYFQNPKDLLLLCQTVDYDNFGLIFDMGNFLCGDINPLDAIDLLLPYIKFVHVKDFLFRSKEEGKVVGYFATKGNNYLCGTVIGKGVVPVKELLKKIIASGYDGYFSIEFEGKEPTLEAIESAKKYLLK